MDDYQSADQMQAMPKVFGNIEQPADAQIGKFVVFGAANAGKSTLVNRLTGEDVSIVSPRPQTTRTRILAAATEGSRQMVFLDTPGVVSRQGLRRVERNVVTSPWLTLGEADLIIILLDAYKLTQKTEEVEKYIFRNLGHRTDVPAVLVINKIDLVEDHEALAAKIADYKQAYSNIIEGPIYISALGNVNVDELKVFLQSKVRPGNWEVPAGVSSDMSTLMRVEELIRAQWFARLTGYLPYVVRQKNVVWKYAEVPKEQGMLQDGPGHAAEPRAAEQDADCNSGMQKVLYIEQQLIVPSEGVAKILLGTGGQKIKDIGRDARLSIARALGHPVRLHLQVTVEKDTTHRK
ncbi:hypothetical protein GGI15_000077 [Coemansia interrupta]|uniref:Era-type G domain-containing protein n=1 Tax=Coemansia interrupta TaxID=1126814 RepID=A0A9W8LP97_9FUNG|nr:hypothetical protein GGI15_000077 [Coemansia interrupta]